MSDKKVFAIDPNLFNFSNNSKTRKKQEKKIPDSKIKMKVAQPKKQDTLKKRSILNMIRKHQENDYKNKFDPANNKLQSKEVMNFNKDFDSAKDFFKNLEENVTKKQATNNHTLKQYPIINNTNNQLANNIVSNSLSHDLQDVSTSLKPIVNSIPTTINNNILPTPRYGCLKNGNLPTYRSFMNQTRKNLPNIGGSSIENKDTNINPNISNMLQSEKIKSKIETINQNQQRKGKAKRKKTIRRTYKIGRSKTKPKVSVLVSNKTIRNNISTKAQLIKQTPIHEIRKYLIKQGFIKVGSTTPNDVLRKMYESAMLICGEIQNHNPDNLLYNFMNDTDK